MPLAQEAPKPMHLLKLRDGVFGGHQQAVFDCNKDFHSLTESILRHCGIEALLHGSLIKR